MQETRVRKTRTKMFVSHLTYTKIAFYSNRYHVHTPLTGVITTNTRNSIFIAVLKLVFTFAVCNLHISSEHLWMHVYVCTAAAKHILYYSYFFFFFFATKYRMFTARVVARLVQ